MSDSVVLKNLQEAKATIRANLGYLKKKTGGVPVDSDCWREAQAMIKEGEVLINNLDQEEASLILGEEWDTCSVQIDREQVHDREKKQQEAAAPSQIMDLLSALEDEK